MVERAGQILGWFDESPLPTVLNRWMTVYVCVCVMHEKKIYSPKCLFPTVTASVRADMVSDPGAVYIHSVPEQAGKCPKPTKPYGVIALLALQYFCPDECGVLQGDKAPIHRTW